MNNTQPQAQKQDKSESKKYLHLTGEMVYLYNEDALLEKDTPILVEGIPDAISLMQKKYSAVALNGVHLKPEHAKKFTKHEKVFLMFDGDKAGRKAIIDNGIILGIKAQVVLLPEGKDPDELSKEELEKIIAEAHDFISYQIQLFDKNTNKKYLPKLLEPLLKQIAELNEVLWEIYLDELKIHFNMSADERLAYKKQLPRYRKEQEIEAIKKFELENNKTTEGENVLGIDENATEADIALQLTLSLGCELLLDQEKEPVIVLPEKPLVAFPVESGEYRKWLSGNYYAYYEKGLKKDTFSLVARTLEGKAYHEGKKITLYNRAAHEGDNIYYDLGNDKTIIHVNPDIPGGWEETLTCPIKFRRFRHQLPQITPLKGGKIETLLKYVNITDENSKLLFTTYSIAALVADISRVMPILIGDPGAAKSTGLRVLRSLIDPSSAYLLIPPTNIPELALAANHHYCAYFDNLSYLTDDYSDVLCRLVSGIGFTKRKLYSDSDDILYNQIVAVGITGINLVATKPDLLDRCLILPFRRISDNERQDEEEFWEAFNNDKPYILGAIFTHLATVLGLVKTLKLNQKPRMATYGKYASAAAIAIGRTSDEFLTAFAENVTRQNRAAIDSSPVAQVIIEFMSDKPEWHGTSSQLHVALKTLAEKSNLEIGGKNGFPKASNWLWKKITPVRPNLNALGIFPTLTEINTGSIISISKKSPDSENTAITATQPESTAIDSKNATTDTATTPIKEDEPETVHSDNPDGTMAVMAVNSSNTSEDETETLVKQLRANNDLYGNNFPVKPLSDYSVKELITCAAVIIDYELDTKPSEHNREIYEALAKKYEEEIKRKQEEGEVNL